MATDARQHQPSGKRTWKPRRGTSATRQEAGWADGQEQALVSMWGARDPQTPPGEWKTLRPLWKALLQFKFNSYHSTWKLHS